VKTEGHIPDIISRCSWAVTSYAENNARGKGSQYLLDRRLNVPVEPCRTCGIEGKMSTVIADDSTAVIQSVVSRFIERTGCS
jgi:hypothetical protein